MGEREGLALRDVKLRAAKCLNIFGDFEFCHNIGKKNWLKVPIYSVKGGGSIK